MATKGFNPFLSEADYAAPSAEIQSNPFLDFGAPSPAPPTSLPLDKPGGNENPFSNPFGVQAQPPVSTAANAFMYGDTTEAPATGGGGGGNPFAAFVDASSSSNNSNGPFSAINTSSSSTIAGESTTTTTTSSNMWDNLVTNQPVTATAAALVPEPIFMMDTGPDESISFFDAGQNQSQSQAPDPPPPTTVHPSTQELLNSVTGALEANSESLMDRLRLNQPSPVNLGVSPSPSPRSPSPDLLMTDEHTPPAPPSSANPLTNPSNQNIMDLFDSPVPQPSGPKSNIDILGLYNNNMSQSQPQQQPQQQQQQQQQSVSIAAVPPSIEETTASLVDTDLPPPPPMPRPPTIEDINFESTHVPQSVSITNDISDLPSPPPPAPASVITSPVISEVIKPPELPPAPISVPMPTPTPIPTSQPEPPRSHPPPPKPPAPAVAPARSPVHETKPLPSRPPPPVPPSPRMAGPPHPPAPGHAHHGQPPPIPQAPPAAREHESHPPPPVPPAPHVAPPHHPEPPVKQQSPIVERVAPPPIPSSSPFGDTFDQPSKPSASSIFGTATTDVVVSPPTATPAFDIGNKVGSATTTGKAAAAFDDFDAKFNSINNEELSSGAAAGGGAGSGSGGAFGDPFGGTVVITDTGDSAWGSSSAGGGGGFGDDKSGGFGADTFDSFLQLNEPPPVPQSTPHKIKRQGEDDDENDQDLAIFIKPRTDNELSFGLAPALAPPPKSPAISTNSAYSEDSNNAFVPFLSSARDTAYEPAAAQTQLNRTDSSETPQTPLFEEDTSQPLEDFPRTKYETEGWEMHMRHPNKKKITGQRFWKKVYVKIVVQNDIPIVHIYTNKGDKDPLQEIPLQPCYSVSDIGAQQFDQFGKIFTLKIQYVFYKERPGVRPGQISKAGRISDKLSQFAAFAIQGDYQGVKEFGSDLKKLGLPLEHAPQISQLVKLGIQDYEELKQFSACVEEALFKLNVHRDRAIQYKTEEVQVTLVDEYYVEQDIYGVVTRQIARVRLMFLSFLSGIAEVEMGMNDIHRQGKEIVGRHDIVPIATEEWIRTEAIEFSNCVQLDEYENTKTIKFKPPDACYLELLRFRVRPPRHRELPLQVKTVFTTTGNRIEIRSDILVPGFTSRKLGQIPCEDVSIRIPIPECWIYMFRVEKHFRYGSVKSSHRRSGKVKGIERFLGAVEAVEPSLMEVTSGQAKYEHHFKSIVWRIPRLPKEGQGAYTTHSFFCHIHLQAHEQVPDNLAKQCIVEFTMPHTTISHTVVRSIAVPGCEEPPEKCVRYLARCEFVVDIEHTQGIAPATYNLAAAVPKEEKKEEAPVSADRTADWFPTEKPKADDDSDFSD